MSNIKDHIVSLETAKKLKEAGYPQGKSIYLWYTNGDDAHLIDRVDGARPIESKSFDAPLATEIELPVFINLDNYQIFLSRWHVWQDNSSKIIAYEYRYADYFVSDDFVKEADAKANMWTQLKQKGMIDGR